MFNSVKMVKNESSVQIEAQLLAVTHRMRPELSVQPRDSPPSKQRQPTLQTLCTRDDCWPTWHRFTAHLLYPLGASASAAPRSRPRAAGRRPSWLIGPRRAPTPGTPLALPRRAPTPTPVPATRGYSNEINRNLIDCPVLSANPWHKRAPGNQLGFKPKPAPQTSMAEASASAEAEARSILERAAESSFPPLHAVHHLLSVEVRLSYLLMCCPVELLSVH